MCESLHKKTNHFPLQTTSSRLHPRESGAERARHLHLFHSMQNTHLIRLLLEQATKLHTQHAEQWQTGQEKLITLYLFMGELVLVKHTSSKRWGMQS